MTVLGLLMESLHWPTMVIPHSRFTMPKKLSMKAN